MLLAIKHAGLQPTMLVATLMSHLDHGPYDSGRALLKKAEVCRQWIEEMSDDEWQELREPIALDRCTTIDNEDLVPESKADLLREPDPGKPKPEAKSRHLLEVESNNTLIICSRSCRLAGLRVVLSQ